MRANTLNMGRVGRDVYRRKLARLLSQSVDEDIVALISAMVAIQSGNPNALCAVNDLFPKLSAQNWVHPVIFRYGPLKH